MVSKTICIKHKIFIFCHYHGIFYKQHNITNCI
ncbi:hypothetical protein BpHYR1_053072, partial [Brachionus plicatilis]